MRTQLLNSPFRALMIIATFFNSLSSETKTSARLSLNKEVQATNASEFIVVLFFLKISPYFELQVMTFENSGKQYKNEDSYHPQELLHVMATKLP